jgi:hypothetical protein
VIQLQHASLEAVLIQSVEYPLFSKRSVLILHVLAFLHCSCMPRGPGQEGLGLGTSISGLAASARRLCCAGALSAICHATPSGFFCAADPARKVVCVSVFE